MRKKHNPWMLVAHPEVKGVDSLELQSSYEFDLPAGGCTLGESEELVLDCDAGVDLPGGCCCGRPEKEVICGREGRARS